MGCTLNPKTRVLVRGGREDREKWGRKTTDTDTVGGSYKASNTGVSRTARGRKDPPHPSRGRGLPAGLQNDEAGSVCCFQPLGAWKMVPAAPGSAHRDGPVGGHYGHS